MHICIYLYIGSGRGSGQHRPTFACWSGVLQTEKKWFLSFFQFNSLPPGTTLVQMSPNCCTTLSKLVQMSSNSSKCRPTVVQRCHKLVQMSSNCRPTVVQLGSNCCPSSSNVVQLLQRCPNSSKCRPTVVQRCPNSSKCRPTVVQRCPKLVQLSSNCCTSLSNCRSSLSNCCPTTAKRC
jgi:hypothetical protein